MSAGPVVILGGAGFIGANLANRLLAAGTPVRVFDNLSRPGTERNVEWLRGAHDSLVDVRIGDVRNEAALRAALADASDVFHFAAQVAVTTSLDEPAADFDVNARGTLNVLEALRERANPPLLFFTSTNKVYGALPELNLVEQPTRYALRGRDTYENGVGEDQPLDFHSPYGCSKGSADQYVLDYARSFGLRTVVFRMSCIYGPRQHGNEDQGWVAHFIKKALNYEPLTIYGDGKQVRDILFIDDLVDAFLAARRDPTRVSGRAFNIGGGPERTLSLLELLDRIDELLRRRPEVSYAAPRFGDQRYYVSDIRRFEKATGWRPRVDVHRGLRELYAWLATSADKRRAAFAPVETRP